MSIPENLKESIEKCNPTHLAILKYGFQSHFLDNTEDKHPVVPYFDLQCENDQISSSQEGNSNNSLNNEENSAASSTSDIKPKNLKCQECKICGRVLSSLASYYVHMKSHSDNKPYHCTFCEISFTRKPYLEVHLRTHTGERPFKCSICDKTFTQKSSLNTHLRVHTGDKPFSCDVCHKSFALKSYLTAHRWSHVGEANGGVSCDICGEVFTSRPQAAAHIRSHTAYACSLCHRSFTKQSFLVRHMARAHPERRLLDLDKRRKILLEEDDSDRESLLSSPPPASTPVLSSRTSSPSPFHPSVRDIGTQNVSDSPRYDHGGRDSPLMTPKPAHMSQPQTPTSTVKAKNNKNVCHNPQRISLSNNTMESSKASISLTRPSTMSQVAFPTNPYNVNFSQPNDGFPNRNCSQPYHIMVPTPCPPFASANFPPVSVPTPPSHRTSSSLYTSHLNNLNRPSNQRPPQ